MILFSSIAFLVALTSTRVQCVHNGHKFNYLTLYVINRKPVEGEVQVLNPFVDFSPLNDTELIEFPSNYVPIRHKPTVSVQKDTRKPVNRNSSNDLNQHSSQSSFWQSNGNPTSIKQGDEIANNIHNPIANFKLVALCDKTLAILDYKNGGDYLSNCELFDLEKNPETAFRKAQKIDVPIQQVDFRTMKETINRCRELSQRSLPMKAAEEIRNVTFTQSYDDSWGLWRGLIPGTKWCGLGDTAKDYNDLGPKRDIDLCCRAHDHCPVRLKAFRYGYGLINFSFYTKSHCECDEDFHRCLKQQPDDVAATLGNFYFNIMKIQCIKEDDSSICLEKKVIKGKEECVHFRPNLKHMKFSQPELSF